MLNFLKKLFGSGESVDYNQLLANGAIIVDVRTPGEFNAGHVKGSLNIPLNTLKQNLKRIDKNKAVIVCCASGVRSGSARSILRQNGFGEVYNAGSWHSLKKYSI